MLIGVEEGELV